MHESGAVAEEKERKNRGGLGMDGWEEGGGRRRRRREQRKRRQIRLNSERQTSRLQNVIASLPVLVIPWYRRAA